MKKRPLSDSAARRREAEARWKAKSSTAPPPAEADLRRLQQELEVHQIELELHNEELTAAHAEVEAGLARYSDLYDFAPTSYFSFDHTGVIRMVNLAGARLFGVERSWLVRRHFGQFLAESDRRVFGDFLHRVFAGAAGESCEVRLLHADIPPLAVQLNGTCSADGLECRAILVDITGRKQAEEAHVASEAKYRQLHESLMDAFCSVDMAGHFREWNSVFQAMLGYSADEVGRLTYQEITPEKWHAGEARIVNEQVLTRGYSDVYEKEYRRKDGTIFPIELRTVLLRDVHQQPSGMWAIIRDITERKLADNQLRKLARAVDQSPVSIVITDKAGHIEFVNPKFTQVTGYTAREVLGRNPRFLKSNEMRPEAYREMWATIHSGREWRGEFHNRRKDGTLFWETAWISPVSDDAGRITHFIAVKEDTTDKKQMEANFLRAQRLESIGALASGIAHDLNNILAPILMIAPLLQNSVTDPDARSMIETIGSSARRGADIIKQLLTFARGQPGVRLPLPVGHLIHDLGKIMRETFPRDIRSRVDVPNDIWPMLGDATQIHQALLNLCVNARDAMSDGGTLTVGVKNVVVDEAFAALLPDAHPGQYVCVSVVDTGSGITPEHLDRIFDPFFTTKDAGKGTGLGLATVLGIVRGHSGFVRVTTRRGQGTTFELYFPASPELPAPPPPDSLVPRPRGQGELVLVVDDEPDVCASLRHMLEIQGYRVITAGQGAEGLAAFSEHRDEVRAVITDMMMPVMNGPAFIAALRAIAPQLPVLGMTGLPERNGLKGLENLELPVLLFKPFSNDELLSALQAELPPSGTASTRKGTA